VVVLCIVLGLAPVRLAEERTFTIIDLPETFSTTAFGFNPPGQNVGQSCDNVTCHRYLPNNSFFTTVDFPGPQSSFAAESGFGGTMGARMKQILQVNCALGNMQENQRVDGVRVFIQESGLKFGEKVPGLTLFILRMSVYDVPLQSSVQREK